MNDTVLIFGIILVYYVLQRWVLPAAGVPT